MTITFNHFVASILRRSDNCVEAHPQENFITEDEFKDLLSVVYRDKYISTDEKIFLSNLAYYSSSVIEENDFVYGPLKIEWENNKDLEMLNEVLHEGLFSIERFKKQFPSYQVPAELPAQLNANSNQNAKTDYDYMFVSLDLKDVKDFYVFDEPDLVATLYSEYSTRLWSGFPQLSDGPQFYGKQGESIDKGITESISLAMEAFPKKAQEGWNTQLRVRLIPASSYAEKFYAKNPDFKDTLIITEGTTIPSDDGKIDLIIDPTLGKERVTEIFIHEYLHALQFRYLGKLEEKSPDLMTFYDVVTDHLGYIRTQYGDEGLDSVYHENYANKNYVEWFATVGSVYFLEQLRTSKDSLFSQEVSKEIQSAYNQLLKNDPVGFLLMASFYSELNSNEPDFKSVFNPTFYYRTREFLENQNGSLNPQQVQQWLEDCYQYKNETARQVENEFYRVETAYQKAVRVVNNHPKNVQATFLVIEAIDTIRSYPDDIKKIKEVNPWFKPAIKAHGLSLINRELGNGNKPTELMITDYFIPLIKEYPFERDMNSLLLNMLDLNDKISWSRDSDILDTLDQLTDHLLKQYPHHGLFYSFRSILLFKQEKYDEARDLLYNARQGLIDPRDVGAILARIEAQKKAEVK